MFTPLLHPLHLLLDRGRASAHPVCHDGQDFVRWDAFAQQVASRAQAMARRSERRWLLATDDSLAFAVDFLALLHAGKQVVIAPNNQSGTLEQLRHAYDAAAHELGASTPAPAGALAALTALEAQRAIIDIYTSGSTGQAKCVRKTLAQFETEVAVLESLWGQALGSATMLASAPHHHFYGLLFRLLWPLSAGRPFDTVTCTQPDLLRTRLAQLGDSALISSPALLSRLPQLIDLRSLQPAPRMIFSSGGPLPAAAAAQFVSPLGQAPTEVFGSTETGGVAWRRQEGSDAWTTMPGIQVLREADGALQLRSPYLEDLEPYRMDDAVELLPQGQFRLLGRLDRIVKIEEKRLSLPDMEGRLQAHPWVAAAAVIALPGTRQSLGAVLVLTPQGQQALDTQGKSASVQALRAHLNAHFEAVLLPRRWRFVAQLPFSERGKLPLAALAALFDAEPGAESAPVLWPQLLSVNRAADAGAQAVLELLVPADLVHFAGHFPGLPILPGVVQIDWALHYAREYLGLTGQFAALEHSKFLAPVRPGARLQLTLKRAGASHQVDFSYSDGGRKSASGRLVFSAAP